MKTLKYLIAALAVAFALAGCAGGSGMANFDDIDSVNNPTEHINVAGDSLIDGGM